jgi:hypothetical protein
VLIHETSAVPEEAHALMILNLSFITTRALALNAVAAATAAIAGLQGDLFAQSVLDKIQQVLPVDSVVAFAAPAAAAAPATTAATAAGGEWETPSGIITSSAGSAPAAAAAALVAASKDAAAVAALPAKGEIMAAVGPQSHAPADSALISAEAAFATPEDAGNASAAHGANAQAAAAAVAIPTMSRLAANAVYVLHRAMIVARPGSNCVRAFLLEHCYVNLWHFSSRFWQSWQLPAARLFEVGLVTEL